MRDGAEYGEHLLQIGHQNVVAVMVLIVGILDDL